VARLAALGFSVGLCDLTAGEMSSNGTVEERLAESEAAAKVLGAAWRENLRWPDRQIGKDPAHLSNAVRFIRQHRPRVVSAPHWIDRHPDHAAASVVVTEAVFNSGLRKYSPAGDVGTLGEPWKVEWICHYFINDGASPSFVVDVSEYYDRKRRALDCHSSQFKAGPNAVGTRLNSPLFRQLIESRDAQFGAQAGVTWAEGLVVREPVVRQTLFKESTSQ
jgi:bacillithiol biosynthesis deacetylase BshB1